MQITLKTLTPLWTGGVDQTCDRLHETGLIGSLRWWYEALVRGLGGYACDPTSDGRCPDENGRRCAACELFGCTGWARKFRLRVLNEHGQVLEDALAANTTFRLEFLELRQMSDEERWLLTKVIELATKYGALGGKTTLKPQRDQRKGADNGIVKVIFIPDLTKPDDIARFLAQSRRVTPEGAADLRWFFFVKGAFLWRKQMNALMRPSDDGQKVSGNEPYQQFLRGRRGDATHDAIRDRPLADLSGEESGRRGDATHDAISKKLFSFRTDGGRIWGYARDARMRDTIVQEIRITLGDGDYTIKTGEEVLHEL